MKKPVLITLASCALAAGAILAGCGSSGSSSSGGSSGSGGTSVKILYLVPTLEDEAYTRETAAAKNEAKNFPDAEIEVTAGGGRQEGRELISKIQNAEVTGVNVIVLDCGGTCEELRPALATATANGIKVIVVAQPVPNFPERSAYLKIDETKAAEPAGEYMAEALHGKGEIQVISCVVGNPIQDERYEGFENGLQGSEVETVNRADAECDPAKARTVMENALTAHPNLVGVYSDTDVALVGALQAIQAAGKNLVIVGHDGQLPILEEIKKGNVAATVRYPSETFGRLGVKTAVEVGEGKEVPKTVPVPISPLITKENVSEVIAEIEKEQQG